MSAKYTPDSGGTRQFMNSKGVSDAMRGVAAEMAAQANQQGSGGYEAQPRTVQGGWSASNRAGAEVTEIASHPSERTVGAWRDAKVRHLVNISRQFRMRGGG